MEPNVGIKFITNARKAQIIAKSIFIIIRRMKTKIEVAKDMKNFIER